MGRLVASLGVVEGLGSLCSRFRKFGFQGLRVRTLPTADAQGSDEKTAD